MRAAESAPKQVPDAGAGIYYPLMGHETGQVEGQA